MQILIDAFVGQVILPALLLLAATASAWLVSRLPGPVRDFLTSGTHQRDMQLLLGALARRASASVMGPDSGSTVSSLHVLRSDLIAYARDALPETIAKLGPSAAALETMATAAIQAARAEQAAIAAAAATADQPVG